MTVSEIGALLGVSRQRVDVLTKSEGFPAPRFIVARTRLWERMDIEAWAAKR